MAFDAGLAEVLRDDLGARDDLEEKRMFGGLVFMTGGHMLCGVMGEGGLFRVGKERMDEALDIMGTAQMMHGGRPMGGFVTAPPEVLAEDGVRARLLDLALAHLESLPPK